MSFYMYLYYELTDKDYYFMLLEGKICSQFVTLWPIKMTNGHWTVSRSKGRIHVQSTAVQSLSLQSLRDAGDTAAHAVTRM